MGSIINITVTTNQSHSLDDTITLLINDSVCGRNNNSVNDVVECDKPSDNTSCSYFILTTISSGIITIRANTNYYGAHWYSVSKKMTIVENCAAFHSK